jgi:hypothetical protein
MYSSEIAEVHRTEQSIKQATQPFMAPLELSKENFGGVPKIYIRAKLDKAMSFSLQNEMIGNGYVEHVFTLESGHFPLASMADELNKTIKSIQTDRTVVSTPVSR